MLNQRLALNEPLFQGAAPRCAKHNRTLLYLFVSLGIASICYLVPCAWSESGQRPLVQQAWGQEPAINVAYHFRSFPNTLEVSRQLTSASSRLHPFSVAKLRGLTRALAAARLARRRNRFLPDIRNDMMCGRNSATGAIRATGFGDDNKPEPEEDEELTPETFMPLQTENINIGVVADAASKLQLPFDPSYPGIKMIHPDPPVLMIEGFMTREMCTALLEAAEASRYLIQSDEGPAFVILDDEVLEGGGAFADAQRDFRSKAERLLPGLKWSPPMQEPAEGTVCFEQMQVVRYQEGQCFPPHEDAFPRKDAKEAGLQRRATMQLYLNDVPEGGETRFAYMNFTIRPAAGNLLLFFPGLANGSPDIATMYAELDAVSTKWIAQQWIAGGFPAENETEKESGKEGRGRRRRTQMAEAKKGTLGFR